MKYLRTFLYSFREEETIEDVMRRFLVFYNDYEREFAQDFIQAIIEIGRCISEQFSRKQAEEFYYFWLDALIKKMASFIIMDILNKEMGGKRK